MIGARPATRRDRLELFVFLLLIVPAIASGFVLTEARESFVVTALATMFHDLGLAALVVFFAWSSGDGLSAIGWTSRRLPRELAIGALLYVPMIAMLAVFGAALGASGLRAPTSPPPSLVARSPADLSLATVLVVVVAVTEETIFRGYLLLRLRAITRSTGTAIALSAIIFASGHAYSGPLGVALIAVLAVFLSLVYLWRRSLVAPIVLHFLQDFIGLVLAPALVGR